MQSPNPNAPWWAALLALAPAYGPLDVKRAYRRLSKLAHPDAGGTTKAMQRLNQARSLALADFTPAR